ncbi:hypothetical protein [Salininema proteolyticum]|uniref:Uncharacterized protein n=1 Tax=Salininema proteolyticum TaxID=1607685 RepID=A0ABV8TZK7_9ACTN
MPVLYLPPDTADLGSVTHDGDAFDVRFDERSRHVYLIPREAADCPVAERPPAVMAALHNCASPAIVIYSQDLYLRSRQVPGWTDDLGAKIARAVDALAVP